MTVTTMKAIEISEPGGPEVLKLVERPVPAPGRGEVLIEVSAAGLNGADLAQRRGVYPPPKGASDLPGLEVSGTVAALGDGVRGIEVGTRVAALLAGGGYAGFVTVEAGRVLPLPDCIDWIRGAAVMETAATVWSNVFDIGLLAEGERLLVHGGSSGIGTTAIQLAKLKGAEVWCTVGSDEKRGACLKLGADVAVNYREESFADRLRDDPTPGADVILDIVGGGYLGDNLKSLRTGGRMAVIALAGGRTGKMDLGRLMAKRLSVFGTTLRSRPKAEKDRIVSALTDWVWPALADGRFGPVVDSVFPISDVADAHRRMEESRHIGKIVLDLAG